MPWWAWLLTGVMMPVVIAIGIAFGPFLWEAAKEVPRLLRQSPWITAPFLLIGFAAALATNNPWFFVVGVGCAMLAAFVLVIMGALGMWFLLSLIGRAR